MIDLAPTRTLLSRFARDLAQQSPRPIDGMRPDLSRCRDVDIQHARVAWATRIVDEFRSVVVFGELLGLLAAVEAPFDTMCTVHRLIGDELRHTKLCADVVGWLGGLEGLEIELDDLGLPPTDDAPASRALEIVARELVVAETESVRVIRAYRDAADDAAIRRAFDILLTDEVRHAAAGRMLLTVLERSLDRATTARLRVRLDDLMTQDTHDIRLAYLEGACGGPGRSLGASLERADLEAVGIKLAA